MLLAGRPLFLFALNVNNFASGGTFTIFSRISIPTTCLQVNSFKKTGHEHEFSLELCTEISQIQKIPLSKILKTGPRSIFILELLQGFFGETYFCISTTFRTRTCSHIIYRLLWSNDFLQNSLVLLRPLIRSTPNLERWG